MSVLLFTPEELQAIYEILIGYENSEIYMWVIDRLRYKGTPEPRPAWDKWKQDEIYRFLLRCSIANQLAFAWSYNKENTYTLEFWDRETTKRRGMALTKRELVDKLSSLSYNCISQGGTVQLTKADEERLEYLIRSFQRRVINDYEQWEASLRETA